MTTTKYMLIENKGEIDINALILMGGSTKRDDTTKVGYYGSGNKYSIALMLKKGIGFKIYSGEKELQITTRETGFRDKMFQQILIDGKETSLTTDMGPQWDSWMGIREWVSNSIDEGESNIINETSDINPKEGYTRIYVEHHDDVKAVIDNWDKYFSIDRVDAIIDNEAGKVFPQIDREERCILYRKGIQCYYPEATKTLYNYDLPNFDINESRVIQQTYTAGNAICRYLAQYATKEMARKILSHMNKNEGYWESEWDWYYTAYSIELSDGWKEAIGDRILINRDVTGFFLGLLDRPHYAVSKTMAKKIKKQWPEIEVYGIGDDGDGLVHKEYKDVTPRMQYQLKKANEFLTECKYNVNHEIEIVEFNQTDVMGAAINGKIMIAHTTFERGIRELVLTIMEEEEHLTSKLKDETRAFQTHLFNKWLCEMENHHGVFL